MSRESPVTIVAQDGEVVLYSQFLSESERQSLFQDLLGAMDWRHEPIRIFGKLVLQPRLTAWVGDPGLRYKYSGITLTAAPWNEPLLMIKKRIEEVLGCPFNSVLMNLYRDGADSMGWHRDNEKELGPQPVIASVSLGAERVFQLRRYRSGEKSISVPLTSGSLLVMRGDCQTFWEHRIPKTSRAVGQRINLTFRRIVTYTPMSQINWGRSGLVLKKPSVYEKPDKNIHCLDYL